MKNENAGTFIIKGEYAQSLFKIMRKVEINSYKSDDHYFDVKSGVHLRCIRSEFLERPGPMPGGPMPGGPVSRL